MVAVSDIIGIGVKLNFLLQNFQQNPVVLAVDDLLTLSSMAITDKFVAESDKFRL